MALTPGTKLGSYEVTSLLGSGGMGDVYLAKDLKLGRNVALKVLPESLSIDKDRLRRFEREARAASALDHSNIVTIHDISEADGCHFIVMQYVPGKTLGELLRAGPLEPERALRYATQAADGLSKAHSQGVVHRDIKPDNIMVTEDGTVKILDFGLAKLTEPSDLSEAPTRELEMAYTKEGQVIGTVPYMSPEQAQGRKVDEKSDIFSFGCVLYEMITGNRPFQSDSAAGVLAAIIRDEPRRVKEIMPSSPAALAATIRRALKKDPKDRHSSMAELRRELREIQNSLSTKRSISSVVRADFPEKLLEAPLLRIATVLLLLLGTAYLVNHIRKPPPLPTEVLPLTTMEGIETDPALSPDGKQVAYIWNGSEDGFYHIYVQLVSGGRPLQLTDASTNDCCPAWSPDGSEIAFQRRGAKGAEIYSVSSLGGSETRLAVTPGFGFTAMRLDWSPDGSTIAVTDVDESDTPPGIFLLSTETGEKKRVTTPPAGDQILDIDPEISPDGRTLAFIRSKHGPMGVADIYVQPVEGGDAIRVTTSELPLYDMDWTADGKALVYASIGRPTSDSWLWTVPAGGGEPSRLPYGEGAQNVSIAHNGNRLVFSQKIEEVNIWRLNGPESSAPGPPTKLISSTRRDYQPQHSPDGSRIAFFSDRTGRGSIWICASDGSNPIELTQEEQAIWPSWSPSGRMIAFNAWDIERGSADVYVIDAEGGFPRNLTDNEFNDGGPELVVRREMDLLRIGPHRRPTDLETPHRRRTSAAGDHERRSSSPRDGQW